MQEWASRNPMAAAVLLALVAAATYGAALPPLAWWPLGWFALTPLCLAALLVSPRQAALVGLVFALAAGLFVSPWLATMIADYFRVIAGIAWVLTLIVWIFLVGAYCAGFCAWLSWACQKGPVSPFTIGAAWWLAEWLRAHGPVPSPWGFLGYTQMSHPIAAQIADLVGPHGVGATLVCVAALTAGSLDARLLGRRPRATAISIGVLVGAQFFYGALRMQNFEVEGPPIRVGLVQAAIPASEQYDEERVSEHLGEYLSLTRAVASEEAEWVFWPELALDFYVEADGRRRSELVNEVSTLDVELLTGGIGAHFDRERRTNAVFHVSGRAVEARYDKVHLMPFAEAYPGGDRFAQSPLLAGDRAVPLLVDGIPIGFAICSEAMLSHHTRELVRQGAEILVTPSIDSWFGSESAVRQQLQATGMRAIESRRFLLRPTTTGYTAIVDPRGIVIAQAPYGVAATLVAEVRSSARITPFVRIGGWLWILPLSLLLLDAGLRCLRPPSVLPTPAGQTEEQSASEPQA
jgi:apolipoprotein N-acyltransferase